MQPAARKSQTRADYETLGGLFLSMAYEDGETLLRVIRAAGLDVNVADPSGKTLIMYATAFAAQNSDKERRNMVAPIAHLLHHGADPNLTDDRGVTAFVLALKLHQRDIAEILFSRGADFKSSIH